MAFVASKATVYSPAVMLAVPLLGLCTLHKAFMHSFAAGSSTSHGTTSSSGTATSRTTSTTTSALININVMRPRILVSQSNSILWNLGFEHYLFEDAKIQAPLLFLWRNTKTIVIGHNQNPWRECDLQKMKDANVTLARRFSGGGAVYQDMGNTCFTFIFPEGHSTVNRNNDIVLDAIKHKYGIHGAMTGRNDLTVEGKKFSGFAAKLRSGRWLQHGTLMRDVDIDALQKYLTPDNSKLQSKGVKSVGARVVNLKSLNNTVTHDGIVEAISNGFRKEFIIPTGEYVPTEYVDENSGSREKVQQYFDNLSDWAWRFGQTPRFSHRLETRFSWGGLEILVDIQSALITDVTTYSDCMSLKVPHLIDSALKGQPYGAEHARKNVQATAAMAEVTEEEAAQLRDVAEWLFTEMQAEGTKSHLEGEL
eukprot:Lankesteria_metandrocarpae@DN5136_c1_g1_i1.p1